MDSRDNTLAVLVKAGLLYKNQGYPIMMGIYKAEAELQEVDEIDTFATDAMHLYDECMAEFLDRKLLGDPLRLTDQDRFYILCRAFYREAVDHGYQAQKFSRTYGGKAPH